MTARGRRQCASATRCTRRLLPMQKVGCTSEHSTSTELRPPVFGRQPRRRRPKGVRTGASPMLVPQRRDTADQPVGRRRSDRERRHLSAHRAHLSAHLSAHLFAHFPAHLSAHLFAHFPAHLFAHFPAHLSAHLSVRSRVQIPSASVARPTHRAPTLGSNASSGRGVARQHLQTGNCLNIDLAKRYQAEEHLHAYRVEPIDQGDRDAHCSIARLVADAPSFPLPSHSRVASAHSW